MIMQAELLGWVSDGITIRRACDADADAIAGILRELGWFPPLDAEPLDTTIQRVREHLRLCQTGSHSVYVAEELDQVIGYVAVHWLPYLFLVGSEGYVSELFVQEAYRGQGVGKTLLTTVKSEAEERGCSRLSLMNSRQRESYQLGFYQKQGWTERVDVANLIYPLQSGS